MTYQPNIAVARSFWQRFKGLMWSNPLPVAQGLLIPRCASVHTLFMRYPLDVIYLDKRGAVVKLVHELNPWRLSWGGGAAAQTLEMTAGGIAHCGIHLGDCLVLPFAPKEHYAQP
jgi:uncharacterized membrane protein (UPF0127 family)